MFEIIPYGVVLGAHIVAFFVNISLVIIADIYGLLWVTGKKSVLNSAVMSRLHKLIWFGLGISIISGVMLAWDSWEYLFTLPAFYTKLIFVLALVVNSFFISSHQQIASERAFVSLGSSEKMPLLISGGVSTFCWIGVVVAAQLLGL